MLLSLMTPLDLELWMTEHEYTYRALASDLEVNLSTVVRWRQGSIPIDRRTELALAQLVTEAI